MKSNVCSYTLSILLLVVVGCAGIRHHPLSVSNEGVTNGIPYYEASPYLLVFSDGKGGVLTQIHYLPDTNKMMAAEPYNTLASLKTTLTFENGVLTQSKDEVDATIIPKAIIQAVAKAAPFLDIIQEADTVPAPYLYKIIVDESTVTFVGAQGDKPIHINLPRKEG